MVSPGPPDSAPAMQNTISENETIALSGGEIDEFSRPSQDPLGVGTLVHALMEEVDFANPGDFEAMIRRLAPLHLGGLSQFLQSENGTVPFSADLNLTIDMVGRFLASGGRANRGSPGSASRTGIFAGLAA